MPDFEPDVRLPHDKVSDYTELTNKNFSFD